MQMSKSGVSLYDDTTDRALSGSRSHLEAAAKRVVSTLPSREVTRHRDKSRRRALMIVFGTSRAPIHVPSYLPKGTFHAPSAAFAAATTTCVW
jgi:hypothetical protein